MVDIRWCSTTRAPLPVEGDTTWDWMWTVTSPPPRPGESRVQPLRPDEWEALADFLSQHNPDTHALPGTRSSQRWFVVRAADGEILGCACTEPGNADVPLLGGITVNPHASGTGAGSRPHGIPHSRSDLTNRRIIPRCLRGQPPRARTLYERLGYAVGCAARTRFVVQPT